MNEIVITKELVIEAARRWYAENLIHSPAESVIPYIQCPECKEVWLENNPERHRAECLISSIVRSGEQR